MSLPAWLSRLLPGSLAARTLLLVVAVVAIAELATFSLFLRHGREEHAQRTTQFIAGQIRLWQSVLPGLDAEGRQRLQHADAGEHEQAIQLRADDAAAPAASPKRGFARRLATELERQLGVPVQVRREGDGRRGKLWIGFAAGGEHWWLVLPPPRFEQPSLPPSLWLGLAASLAVLLLIAGLFVRGIVRPLARLGDAVTQTGAGQARTVTPEGPREVRQLAACHNTMVAQLAAANAERREMLAGLTHDLRAPLARLRLRLALLEGSAERDGIARDADDMERIVGQCLAFLRSEQTGTTPATPLPIADAVSNEVARQRELGRPVAMSAAGGIAACTVAIDRGSLQRILDNLIDNALQYGAPPVEVSLAVEQPGSMTLRVRDHGRGIGAEEREHARAAFVQIEPARATRGSCGLGLAIVHRIVDACGGEMILGEAEGGGLEVTMRLPLTDSGTRGFH